MCIKCILCETTKVQNTLSNSLFLSLSLSPGSIQNITSYIKYNKKVSLALGCCFSFGMRIMTWSWLEPQTWWRIRLPVRLLYVTLYECVSVCSCNCLWIRSRCCLARNSYLTGSETAAAAAAFCCRCYHCWPLSCAAMWPTTRTRTFPVCPCPWPAAATPI